MAERAESLAKQFEQANDELAQVVERCSEQQWKSTCPEGRTVAAVAAHVGDSHQALGNFLQMLANGQPLPPMTMADLDAMNAQAAQQNANVTKQAALEGIRSNGKAMAQALRGLSDEQLERSGTLMGNPMTTEQFVQAIVIGHPKQHAETIRQGMGA